MDFSSSFSGFSFSGLDPNLRFTSYFIFSFDLFLSNCWLLIFGFLQDSVVKSRFWTFFSVNYCFFAQQPRIRVFKRGFQSPGFLFLVSNTNWSFIFQVKPENGHFLVYFNRPDLWLNSRFSPIFLHFTDVRTCLKHLDGF